jgi:hypothetical protein
MGGGAMRPRGGENMENERRKGTRLLLDTKLVIRRLDRAGSGDIPIEVIDLSKSGIGFTSSQELEKGVVYECDLRIWTQEVIHAFLQIARSEKKGELFEHGAYFIGMPEMDSARIDVYHLVEKTTKEMNEA